MARQTPKIKTRSWVMYHGELTEVKDLPPAERAYLAAWIKAEMLNAQFVGRAEFTPDVPDPRCANEGERAYEQLQAP